MKSIAARHYATGASVTAALVMSAVLVGRPAAPATAAHADATDALAVTTARVAMTEVVSAIDVGGVVQARTTATLSARILAPVREVAVRPGDEVRQGRPLIVLDGDDLAAGAHAARAAAVAAEQASQAVAAERVAAEADLALARASHERIAGLQAKRSATAQELDDATALLRSAGARDAGASARAAQAVSALESARATSDQARTVESFTTITAPFDGTVTETFVEPGNVASPGMPLLRLEDTREFRLEVRMDESRVGRIHNGDCLAVVVGSDTTSMTGTVVEVSRAVEADARAFLVKIALPGARGLRSGQFGKARLGGTPRRGLTVPSSAIVRRGQLTSVFVVEQGVARVRLVHLGESEVLAGLAESDVVILSPPPGLRDGRRVSVGGR